MRATWARLAGQALTAPGSKSSHSVISSGWPSYSYSYSYFVDPSLSPVKSNVAHSNSPQKVTFNQLPYYSYYRPYVKSINTNSGEIGQSNQNTFGTSFAGGNRCKSLPHKGLRRAGGARRALSPYATRVYVNVAVQIPCQSTSGVFGLSGGSPTPLVTHRINPLF